MIIKVGLAAIAAICLCSCSSTDLPNRGNGQPNAVAAPSAVSETTDSKFKQDVLLAKEPVLVDFYATWCGPCRMMAPIIDELSQQYKGKLKVVRLDVDANPGVSSALDIRGLPTFAIFKNGKPVRAIVGAQPKEVLAQQIDESIKQ